MATIANLLVNLGMNTAKFSAGAKGANKTLAGMAKSAGITALATSVTAGIAALGGLKDMALNAADSIRAVVSEAVELVDSSDELAQSLGTNVTDLSRLQFAAELAGSDAEALNKALEKMNLTLGKAFDSPRIEGAFADLGLSIEELLELDAAERFMRIKVALSQVESQAERTAKGAAIFGKGIAGINNLISASTEEIRAMVAESDRLGNTISEIDAETLGDVDNQIKRLEASFRGLKRSAVTDFAPAIETATFVLTEFVRDLGDADSDIRRSFDSFTDDNPFGRLLSGLAGLATAPFEKVSRGLQFVADAKDNLSAGGDGVTGLKDLEEEVNELFDKLDKELELFGLKGNDRDIAELAIAGVEDTDIAALQEMADELDAMDAAADAWADSQKRATEIIADSIAPADKLVKDFEELETLHESGLLSLDQMVAAVDKLNSEFDKAEKQRADDSKSDVQKRAEDRINEIRTPLQKMRAELKDIGEEFNAGLLTTDQADLAAVLAEKDFAESLPDQDELTGNPRPAALQRGTAAAFSASFGPVAKPLDKLAKINQEILAVQRRIEEQLQ